MQDDNTITIITGLPRSGTSMIMQMLSAGGMPLLADDTRPPDEHNPRGYFEYGPVKRTKHDVSWLPPARGKAVKVVSYLLPFLPPGEDYAVIFIHRPLAEVMASQNRMLGNESGAQAELLELENEKARAWIQRQAPAVLHLEYHGVLARPADTAAALAKFLDREFDLSSMANAVAAELHRNRGM